MNRTAHQALQENIANAKTRIAILQEYLDGEQGLPEHLVTWGNVGSAAHIAETLRDLTFFITGAEEA